MYCTLQFTKHIHRRDLTDTNPAFAYSPWNQEGYLLSLSLSDLICRMEMLIIPTLLVCSRTEHMPKE